MRPVFKEFIDFLNYHKYSDYKEAIDLKEGKFWINRGIIKGIAKDGSLIKLARLKPFYDGETVKVDFSFYKYTKKELELIKSLETWDETINREKDRINMLEKESLNIIKEYTNLNNNRLNATLTSFGKDSAVTLHLGRKLFPDMLAIFGNTSLDCADTYKHAKATHNVLTINPKEGFYQWRERYQYIPTRFNRACCDIFKEGSMIEHLDESDKYNNREILFLMGMRNEESSGRSGYGDEWRNNKWGDRKWDALLPIRKWTEFDVWLYILKEGVDFNEKYRKGYMRVGCAIACPYSNMSTWMLDQYWYKNMYDRWHNILEKDFINNQKWGRLNCTLEEYHSVWNGGKIRKEPTEAVVIELMKHKGLDDIEVAKSYFNNTCCEIDCNKNVVDSDLVAMNMKFLGRNTQNMYCKKHFRIRLDMSVKEYNQHVEDFKIDECNLF